MTDIVIEPSSNSHHNLPDDIKILVQLIVDGETFLQTAPVEKNSDHKSWKLGVNCDM